MFSHWIRFDVEKTSKQNVIEDLIHVLRAHLRRPCTPLSRIIPVVDPLHVHEGIITCDVYERDRNPYDVCEGDHPSENSRNTNSSFSPLLFLAQATVTSSRE